MFTAEKKRLKTVLAVFGFSYVLRSAVNLIEGLYFERVIEFMNDSTHIFELANLFLFILTDLLPISLLYSYHHFNFRTFNL